MSKKIVRSLVFAIAGVLALSLRAVADPMFYIGETGYDTWASAMNAANNGDTVVVGANTEMGGTQVKSLTIDLYGHELIGTNAYIAATLTVAVIDTGVHAGSGMFELPNGWNVQGTLDLTALASNQFVISGSKFWTGASTVVKFPKDWTLEECAAAFANKVVDSRIVAQGVAYTWDGTSWEPEGGTPTYDIAITAPQNGTLETSVTNDVTAGTTVTVTATPAEGYQLVSVTTNGVALVGNTFTMPSEDVTVAATFEENATPPPSGDDMFYVGDTGYGSWMDAYANAATDATIVAGTNSVIDQVDAGHPGVIGKSVTIDLNGHDLSFVEGWLTACTVTIVDNGTPVGSGLFTIQPSGMNISGGTLDLSALSGSQIQVNGKFRMSSKSLLKFPSDLSLDDCTPLITIEKGNDEGKGARIVVQGVTYVYDGTGWGVAFKITSIDVYDDVVVFGVVAPEAGSITITGSETVNGTYNALTTTKISDGLYRVPVSNARFFKAALEMQ